jgi:RNase P subunit RPR2
MTAPEAPKRAICPKCAEPMRSERDGVREPPMPHVFWLCVNVDCEDGKRNRIYSGG